MQANCVLKIGGSVAMVSWNDGGGSEGASAGALESLDMLMSWLVAIEMVERRQLCFVVLMAFVVSMSMAFSKIYRFTHGAVRGEAT